MVLEGTLVSSFHAKIEFMDGDWLLMDLGSRNGTFVNQQPMVSGESHPLQPGDVLTLGSSEHPLHILDADAPPRVVKESTHQLDPELHLADVALVLDVSANEEQVFVTVESPHRPPWRWKAREHGYLLLTLARARQEDQAAQQAREGWRTVDDLCRMMRVTDNYLHILVHRLRKQFAEAGLVDAKRVVEVDRGRRRLAPVRCIIRQAPS